MLRYNRINRRVMPIDLRRLVKKSAIPLLLAGLICVIYCRALDSAFIFDDHSTILDNPSITHLAPLVGTADRPGPLNPPPDISTSGRPLVNLSFALNYFFGGFNPPGYHALNIFIHLLSVLFLAAIIRRILELPFFAERFCGASAPLAFAVALIWAVHPLQSETVIYTTQRTELFVGFFYLAALYASLRYWQSTSTPPRAAWLAVTAIASFGGMASKEVMVTAPILVLLFDRTFISPNLSAAIRKSWPLYAVLSASWLLLLLLNISRPRGGTAGFGIGVSAIQWWLTQSQILWLYLKLVFWPRPLSIHYGTEYLTTFADAWPFALATVALVAASICLLWRRMAAGFISAAVLLILAPTLIVPIVTEIAAERRMYLPLAALIAFMVVGVCELTIIVAKRFHLPDPRTTRWSVGTVVAPAAIVSVALSLVTVNRLTIYRDELTLWQEAVAQSPTDFIVLNNLGLTLLKQGRTLEAIPHFEAALRANTSCLQALMNLGAALFSSGRAPEALQYFQQALRLNPSNPEVHSNLALALLNAGEPREAIAHFKQALAIRPYDAELHNDLGKAWLVAGDANLAINEFTAALELNPTLLASANNLGDALSALGRLPEAIEQYQHAIALKPQVPEPHYNLGNALLNAGRTSDAIDQYREAIRLRPDYPDAHANLAVSYAALGRSADAQATGEKALALARAKSNLPLAERIRAWLDSFPNQPGPAQ